MKNENYYKQHIATVPGFPKEGIMFRDVTPTLENPEAFSNCINDLKELADDLDYNKIICADARGFIFGSPLALYTHKPLVISRKPNKLPRPGISYSYKLEYGENTMVISEGSILPGDKLLIVDDLLATGGSAVAMIEMIKQLGATPVGAVFYIELPDIKGKEFIQNSANIPVRSLVKFEGE